MSLLKNVAVQIGSLAILLILAAIPLFFLSYGDRTVYEFQDVLGLVQHFLTGLLSGESFYYIQGDRTRFLPGDLSSYFASSYLYLAGSGVILLILSFVFGIWFMKKTEKWLGSLLSLIGMLPDFILILLMQMAVVYFFKTTGIKTVKVASASISEPAIFLPVLTFILIPFVYLVRTLSGKTREIISADFIATAVSKGLGKRQIWLFHVTTNVIPFLKADLYKVTAIMISNLFVIEYLYNTRGITALLFQFQNKFGYQYNVVIFCLLALLLLYFAVYYTLRLVILFAERMLAHE